MTSKKVTKKRAVKKKVAAKKKAIKPDSAGDCFVMMPFKDPFDLYYQAIYKPAIEDSNFKAIRADDLFRPSVIVSDIWTMVRNANVLIAELTTKNANVFYELGLAHAVGKPVILVSESMNDVPFDLQQLRVLLYNKDDPSWGEKLREEISISLKEVQADPIEAVPTIFRKKVESFAPEQDELSARLENLESQVRLLRIRPTGKTSRPSLSSRINEARVALSDIHSEEELDDFYQTFIKIMPRSIVLDLVEESPDIPDGERERLEQEFG